MAKVPKLSITQDASEDLFRNLVMRYLAPSLEHVRRAPLMFRATLIIGPMGSGKTTFVQAKLGEVVEKLLSSGVDEAQICYVYAREARLSQIIEAAQQLDLQKCLYLYVFNDDAPVHHHGRRAMSRENVEESKFYIMIRHRLRERGFTGYLHAVHAAQVYHLIDVTFRRTAALKLFKDYPDEPNDYRLVAALVGEAGLQALLELSLMLYGTDPDAQWKAVHSAVAVFKRFRRLVRAKPGKARLLERVQRVEALGGEEVEETSVSQEAMAKVYAYWVKLLRELRRSKMLVLWGSTVKVRLPRGEIHIPRSVVPKEALEA